MGDLAMPGCLIEDSDDFGARILWVLYEQLELLSAERAAVFAQHFALEISLAATYCVTERSVFALTAVSRQLDALAPVGFYFGIDPLDERRVGWWPEAMDNV